MSTKIDVLAEYQKWAVKMWNYDDKPVKFGLRDDFIMSTGLGGETGEVLEILKKAKRRRKQPDLQHLTEELGDVLYYLTLIAHRYNIGLSTVMAFNIAKIEKRKAEKLEKVRLRKVKARKAR